MTKFWWWTSWSSEKFETYLEEMALSGYILIEAKMGMTKLLFKETEPTKVRYCVDYYNTYSEEYDSIVKDDGWILKGKSSGWYLWSKVYTKERPNLFTDKLSIVERNKRLLRFLVIILMAQLPVAVINYSSISESTNGIFSPFGFIVIVLYTFVLTMLVYSLIKILQQNKRLM